MKRTIFYILSISLIMVLSIITILSVMLQDLKYYTELTLGLVEKRTGLRVTIDDINLAFPKGAGLRVDNLAIFDPKTGENIFRSKRLYMLTEIPPLLKKKFMVTKLLFLEPEASMSLHYEKGLFLARIPLDMLTSGSYETSSGISFQLKNLDIQNGKIGFSDKNLSVSTRLEGVNISTEQIMPGSYRVGFSANPVFDSGTGNVSLDAEILFPDSSFSFQNTSVESAVSFKKIDITEYLQYLPDSFNKTVINSVLDGEISISKQRGTDFKAAGTLNSDNFLLASDKTDHLNIAPFTISFQTYYEESTLHIDRFEATLPDQIRMQGKAKVKTDPLFLDMKLSSGIMDINKIRQYIEPAITDYKEINDFLKRIKSGNVQIKEIIFSGTPGKTPSHFNAFTLIDNVSVNLDNGLPLLNISEGFLNLANNATVDAYMSAELFGEDKHIIKASIVSVFDKPRIKAEINSSISSDSLLNIAANFKKEDYSGITGLINASGEINAKTTINLIPHNETGFEFSSILDLEDTGFEIEGVIGKDKGLPLKLELNKKFADGDSEPPLVFGLQYLENLSLSGTVSSLSPFETEGAYIINELPISSLSPTFMPPEFTADGVFSGTGTFSFPFKESSVSPLTGTLFIKDFSVKETGSEESFAYSNMGLEIEPDSVLIKRSYVKFGETSLFLDGTLTDINPIGGNIAISAENIDIGNFMDTIDSINDQIQKKGSTGKAREFFGSLKIKSGITTDTVRFRKWDGDNSESDFMLENGVMLWDNITINTDDGFLKGSIMYDFSALPLQTLRFDITESDVDTAWAVPELKKTKIMTGRLILTGTVQSDFPKDARIIPKLRGDLSVLINKGKLLRFTILSKILSIINLPRLFQMDIPDPLSKGMPFDSITADLKVEKGVFSTDDFMLKSPSMNLSAAGNIDTVNDSIDFTSGVQILPAITKLIGNIPIAGNILLGDEGTITAGYFQIYGNLYNPSVKPMPIKSINRAVVNTLENIFSIPMRILAPIFRDNGSNNKDAPEEEE